MPAWVPSPHAPSDSAASMASTAEPIWNFCMVLSPSRPALPSAARPDGHRQLEATACQQNPLTPAPIRGSAGRCTDSPARPATDPPADNAGIWPAPASYEALGKGLDGL